MIPSVYLFMATRGVFINQHVFLSQHCLILKILDLDLPEAYFPHSSYMIVLACFMDYRTQNQQTQPPVA